MNYKAFMRQKLLSEMYDKLSDEEKRLFVQLSMQNKNHEEIMQALNEQKADIEGIKSKQHFLSGYGSDLLANFTSAGILWLGSKLFSK